MKLWQVIDRLPEELAPAAEEPKRPLDGIFEIVTAARVRAQMAMASGEFGAAVLLDIAEKLWCAQMLLLEESKQ